MLCGRVTEAVGPAESVIRFRFISQFGKFISRRDFFGEIPPDTSAEDLPGIYMRFGEVVKKAPHFSFAPPPPFFSNRVFELGKYSSASPLTHDEGMSTSLHFRRVWTGLYIGSKFRGHTPTPAKNLGWASFGISPP